MNFTVGARGSKLSIIQTDWVISELQKTDSSLLFDINMSSVSHYLGGGYILLNAPSGGGA